MPYLLNKLKCFINAGYVKSFDLVNFILDIPSYVQNNGTDPLIVTKLINIDPKIKIYSVSIKLATCPSSFIPLE